MSESAIQAECPHCGYAGAMGISMGDRSWQRCNACRRDFGFTRTQCVFTTKTYDSYEAMMSDV